MDGDAARPLISLPFQQGRAAQRASFPLPVSTRHDREIQTLPSSSGASVQFNRLPRGRTQTAPPTPMRNSEAGDPDVKKMRRFSLTSALSRQRMDALRTTVVPHPPVPVFPRPPRCYVPDTGTWVEITDVTEGSGHRDPIIRRPANNARQSWAGFMTSQPGASGLQQIQTDARAVPTVMETACTGEPRHSTSAVMFQSLQTPPPSPIQVRRSSAIQQSPQNGTPVQQKSNRTRRFSFSSALSKRASRARSIIKGRRTGEDESTSHETPTTKDSSHGAAATVTDGGVQFDMLTLTPALPLLEIGYNSDVQEIQTASSVQNEFPSQDSELDSMSFANTMEMRDSSISSTSFEFYSTPSSYTTARLHASGGDPTHQRRELGNDHSPLAKRLYRAPSTSFALGTSFGSEQDASVDACERDEERGFLQSLGLEFDEIVRRARDG
ncbi:hypothetical protein B0H21DRAFT_393619 [Amylocystis lapponica]|nr:hypothetical protein B0H21DRAFT_393619 [Amylocystis lapponica]